MYQHPLRSGDELWQERPVVAAPQLARSAFFARKHLIAGEMGWWERGAWPEAYARLGAVTVGERMAASAWASVSAGFDLTLRDAFQQVSHLGPLRRAPQRYSVAPSGVPTSVGTEGQHFVELLDGREQRVNDWLKKLDIPYIVSVERAGTRAFEDLRQLQLTDTRNNAVVSLRDVGFGISQVLPIVVECLSHEAPETIIIEQPELHLHPRLQAELADLFIEATEMPDNDFSHDPMREGMVWRRQLLVETHSEALLLRIQRRIREGKLHPNWVAVLYVDPQPDGMATIQRLRLDRAGMFIDEWPEGFFEERLRERLAGYEN